MNIIFYQYSDALAEIDTSFPKVNGRSLKAQDKVLLWWKM